MDPSDYSAISNRRRRKDRDTKQVKDQISRTPSSVSGIAFGSRIPQPKVTGPESREETLGEFLTPPIAIPAPPRIVTMPSMPRRNAREAPHFVYTKPRELLRFFKSVEELFDECSVVDDQKKKEHVCSYADIESEEEWKVLKSFSKGPYDKWKQEVFEQYAESENLVNGTYRSLINLTEKFHDIGVSDEAEFMQLKRRWLVESGKLQKDPPLLSNREEIALWLQCFDQQVRELILLRLSQMPTPHTVPGPLVPGVKVKRREDLYEMSTVMEITENIMKGAYGTYSYKKGHIPNPIAIAPKGAYQVQTTTTLANGTRVKDEDDDIKAGQALLLDRIELVDKNRADFEKRSIDRLEELFKSLSQGNVASNTSFVKDSGTRPTSMGRNQPFVNPHEPPNSCHWCWGTGHFVLDCPTRNQQLTSGKIKKEPGSNRTWMANGTVIPGTPLDRPPSVRIEMKIASDPTSAQLLLTDLIGTEEGYASVPGVWKIPEGEPSHLSQYSQGYRYDMINNIQQGKIPVAIPQSAQIVHSNAPQGSTFVVTSTGQLQQVQSATQQTAAPVSQVSSEQKLALENAFLKGQLATSQMVMTRKGSDSAPESDRDSGF